MLTGGIRTLSMGQDKRESNFKVLGRPQNVDMVALQWVKLLREKNWKQYYEMNSCYLLLRRFLESMLL